MDPMIGALLRPEAYDHPVGEIRLVETHISWVLLAGPYAYKVKKPVNLGFVDFTSLEGRRWYCREELRLNRRLAPEMYLGLVSIHGPRPSARFHGDGPEIEVAVRMLRFPQDALLSELLIRGDVEPTHFERLAERLARFHADAAVLPADAAFGDPEAVKRPAIANLDTLEACGRASAALLGLRHWTMAEHERLRPVFLARKAGGQVRECHGDLHLGNMVFHDGRIQVFDCLEFNPGLRWIDIISDIAFLAMDLQHLGRADLASLVLNRWLDTSGDLAGLMTWRWYLTYRALVRAKVTALRLAAPELSAEERRRLEDDLLAYLDLAGRSTLTHRPTLLITHGVSGSGKTFRASRLVQRGDWIHLRSDVERLRRFGRWPAHSSTPMPGDPYRPEVTEALYHAWLPSKAEQALAAGFSVVVDATFLRRAHRTVMSDLAKRMGVGFGIIDCPVPESLARRRIVRRREAGTDPSEADGAVLRHQLQDQEDLTGDERTLVITPVESPMPPDGDPPS